MPAIQHFYLMDGITLRRRVTLNGPGGAQSYLCPVSREEYQAIVADFKDTYPTPSHDQTLEMFVNHYYGHPVSLDALHTLR